MVAERKEHHGMLTQLDVFKQSNEYDCGVYATAFFLFLCGAPVDFCDIAANLKPTPEKGTDSNNILLYCAAILPPKSAKELGVFVPHSPSWWMIKSPCIVNFQYEDDGHYGVVTAINKDKISIFEPYRGRVITMTKKDFLAVWYSHNNGPKWMLRT